MEHAGGRSAPLLCGERGVGVYVVRQGLRSFVEARAGEGRVGEMDGCEAVRNSVSAGEGIRMYEWDGTGRDWRFWGSWTHHSESAMRGGPPLFVSLGLTAV